MTLCIVCGLELKPEDRIMTRFRDDINLKTGEKVHSVEGRLHKACSGKETKNE